ncbi:MAG TPA: NFACT RNA binding domain-containing protein [Cyclobacteriaceae bacterium]|nr:NFACT RNA binding domain-containing protein [Cyclobacteriaceae bacterium]HRF34901.1 NFACT RNA binding domain-containing protein [Cyclobacteriaceae bacterium]
MHNNYYLLKQLSNYLHHNLIGFTVVSCFSQNKDELVIEFNNSVKSFFIKASLQSDFCCLSFPNQFNRAKKNSIDLFTEILVKQVKQVYQFENERCFAIDLADRYTLLFKMHGNRANVILYYNQTAISIFRSHLKTDLTLSLATLNHNIDFSEDFFQAHLPDLRSCYSTFGKLVWEYWDLKTKEKTDKGLWPEFQSLLGELESPTYLIIEKSGKLCLSLVPVGTILKRLNNPAEALNTFFTDYVTHNAFNQQKHSRLKTLYNQIKAGENYLQKNKQKLAELQQDTHYQLWGDLLMAHLHILAPGTAQVTLTSFYDNQPVDIKLKPDLSPQKNAEVFYRKAKNQQIEIAQLQKAIDVKTKELEGLNHQYNQIELITDLKELRQAEIPESKKQKNTILPYHEFEHKGFRIWVGRNAEANDELTLKRAYKEDLWLHAKDVAGSHVLIKYQAGKPFPKDVIERAAQLAAYNSKRKTDSLCPVVVTQKKYVRKRKGDPAGAVVVEREQVILVEPKL